MKKIFALLFLACFMAASIGCGGDTNTGKTTKTSGSPTHSSSSESK